MGLLALKYTIVFIKLCLCVVPLTVTGTGKGVGAKLSSFVTATGSPLEGFLPFRVAGSGSHEDDKKSVEFTRYGNNISESSTNETKAQRVKTTQGAISRARRSLQVHTGQSGKDDRAVSNGVHGQPRTGVVLVGALAAFEFIVSKIIWIAITGALMFLLKIMTVGTIILIG